MSDEPAPDGAMEIAMPFVTVASVGGPHDDESYTCGYEAAILDAELGLLEARAAGPLTWAPQNAYHAANWPQLDLLAMGHGFAAKYEPFDDQWGFITFTRLEPVAAGVQS